MRRMYEREKVDVGVVSQALNNTDVTGKYHAANRGQRVWAPLNVGAMAATKTAKIEFLQATDAAGTGAKAIDPVCEATITANAAVTECTIDLTSVANTDTVTVNDVTFTKAGANSLPDREFADAAGLVLNINGATYGVTGVTATANGAVVTLVSTELGEVVITTSRVNNAGTITLATTKALAYVELDVSAMDLTNLFNHYAIKITTTADTTVSALLLSERYLGLAQNVAASGVV